MNIELSVTENPVASLILAHGAGQSMHSDFMLLIRDAILQVDSRIQVVRFNFPYMEKIKTTGRHRPPDKQSILEEFYHSVIREIRSRRECSNTIIIGGKSLGGRIASMIADEAGVDGVVCLGYPFHPPSKPERLRTEHLQPLRTPTLICQGERDPFGNRVEVPTYVLSELIETHWLVDGEHSFKTRKSSGVSQQDNIHQAASVICDFVNNRI